MAYQWFPGHMQKAITQIKGILSSIDVVVELVDARIPLSSRNPELNEIFKNKKSVIVLNKADLADPVKTKAFIKYFKEMGIPAVAMDSKTKNKQEIKQLLNSVRAQGAEKVERLKKKGMLNPKISILIAGVPNVGKSTLINSLYGKKSLKVGNKPGVTVKQQWLMIDKGIDLLDTPGIFATKFDNNEQGMLCAAIGSISDEIIDRYELGVELAVRIHEVYPGTLEKKYAIEESEDGAAMIKSLADKRRLLLKGGELDLEKASILVTDDFRAGRLGLLTLDVIE